MKTTKTVKALMINALVLIGLSAAPMAEPASQTGGIPSLDGRVGTLETTVAEQGTTGAALQVSVDDLQNQLNTVQNDILAIERHLPMFAVVNADGTLRASRGVISAGHFLDSSGNPLKGAYKVRFEREVSLCAVTVTAEPSGSAAFTASVNGTFRGIPNP